MLKLIYVSAIVLALAGCGTPTYQDPADMQARAAMIQAWPGVHPYYGQAYQMQSTLPQSTYRLQTQCYRSGPWTNCY